jgi:CBS domain containing-hemolysin-like protein
VSGLLALVVGTLVAALGFLAAAGAATARRVDLYRWAAGHRRSTRAAVMLLGAPKRILRAASGLAALALTVAGLGLASVARGLPPGLATLVTVVVGVPVILIVAYAVPRAVGRRWSEGTVRLTVPVLQRVGMLVAPVEGERRAEGTAVEPLLEGGGDETEQVPTDDELAVLAGVLSFVERPVREVMTPRTEIVALPEGAPLDQVAAVFAEAGYSRIPVYRESLDNIVGMVYAFDLLRVDPAADLPIRTVSTAPASKPCADLLFDMQRHRRQLAVVLDEYGGTAGIVTLKDLLEELVGEIFEEYDATDYLEGPGPVLMEVTGGTPVDEVAARLEVPLPDVAETIGGTLARAAGRIPRVGDRYLLAGLEFDVLEATATRLDRIVIRRTPVATIALGGRSK